MAFLSRSKSKSEGLRVSSDGFKTKLTDPDALSLWKKCGKMEEPPVPQFLKAFEECMKSWQVPLAVDDIILLQSFIGLKPGVDHISLAQFADLCRAFGSVKLLVPAMQKLAKEDWWCGWLTGEETTEILSGHPRGTFLARFTKTYPGCLAITFISPEAEIRSMVFQRGEGGLLTVKSDDGKAASGLVQFQDLHAAITGFKSTLSTPFATILSKKDWYRDNIPDRAAAEDLLAHLKPGTFVIWPDPTTANRYISSLVVNPGGFIHTEIVTPPGDLRTNNAPNIPSSSTLLFPQESRARVLLHIQNHIRLNRHMLKYPIRTGTVPLMYLHGGLRGETPLEAVPALNNSSASSAAPQSDLSSALEAPILLSTGTSSPHSASSSVGGSPPDPLKKPPSSEAPRLHTRGENSLPASAVARLVVERYCVQQFHNWTVLAAADGCEEETKNREAAAKAVVAFVESMRNQRQRVIDVLEAEHCLLRALNFAHSKIVEGKDPRYVSVGSASLIGGILVELAEADRIRDYRHAFVCANLGNWKAFVYSPENGDAFVEVTADNRTPSSSRQLRQPGGRLGAYIDNAKPDIKGLESYCELVREGDIILLLSDGIHTNLDPRNLGKTPTEMGMPYQTWEAVPQRQFHTACRLFEANLLKRIASAARQTAPDQTATAQLVANALVDYAMQITAALRSHVVENPGAKTEEIPLEERKNLPGWLGECTCVAIHVGRTRQQRDHRLSLSASAPALGSSALRSSGSPGIPAAASGPIHSSPVTASKSATSMRSSEGGIALNVAAAGKVPNSPPALRSSGPSPLSVSSLNNSAKTSPKSSSPRKGE